MWTLLGLERSASVAKSSCILLVVGSSIVGIWPLLQMIFERRSQLVEFAVNILLLFVLACESNVTR